MDRTFAFIVSVKTVCGTRLYLSILSLVLKRLDRAGLEMSLTALWVVTLRVFSACFSEMFHLEARCSGFRPVCLEVEVDIIDLFNCSMERNYLSLRVGSMLWRIGSEEPVM